MQRRSCSGDSSGRKRRSRRSFLARRRGEAVSGPTCIMAAGHGSARMRWGMGEAARASSSSWGRGGKDLSEEAGGPSLASLSPRRCGGVGRRAGPAGTARGVRPRSVEQTSRGKTTRGGREVLGRWTDSAGWASGPRPLGSRGVFFPFAFFLPFIYFSFLFYF